MTLLDRQRRATELGRIRIGMLIDTGNGRTRPSKLDTFRLTSPDRAKLEKVAAKYGGQVREWTPPRGRPAWEVVTETDRLPVQIPPGSPISQFYERWPAGNCDRRCDGVREEFSRGPCLCPADLGTRKEAASMDPPQACKPRTRLSVILSDIPGIGVWVLTSAGDQAADELAGVAEMLHTAALQGVILPAFLRVDQRETRNRGQVKKYPVPVLDVVPSFDDLLAGQFDHIALGAGRRVAELPAGASAAPPVQEVTDEAPRIDERSQQIVDEAMDDASDADLVRDLWRIAGAEGRMMHVVTWRGQTGSLKDLLTVRLRVLTGVSEQTPA